MLTGVFSSTVRNVTGSEFVRKNLSIALPVLTGDFVVEATFGGQQVDKGVCRVRRNMCDKCAWWPRTSLDCDPVVAGLHFITCWVLSGGQLFLRGSVLFGVRSFAEVISTIWFSCANVVIFSKMATTTELTLTA